MADKHRKAPAASADAKEHKRHAEEFLKDERYTKKPTSPEYREKNDEANP
jgi:hypothetical protein